MELDEKRLMYDKIRYEGEKRVKEQKLMYEKIIAECYQKIEEQRILIKQLKNNNGPKVEMLEQRIAREVFEERKHR